MDEHRLPRDALPALYDLHLTADPNEPRFQGEVAITCDMQHAVDQVVLNARGLRVTHARAEQDGRVLEAEAVPDAEQERLVLRLPQRLVPGKAELHIAYEGDVGHGMSGLYLSKDGDESCLATQCEATDARAIVPCFDEPDMKAVWAWTITAPAGLTVLANSPLLHCDEHDGRQTCRFQPTPPMSSYLIACAIGRFQATEPIDVNGRPFRVWALGDKARYGDHGNRLAADMVGWYEEYFGQEYAFAKYDQLAVPSFAFGAMENPGLVVFRPSLLLLDPGTASWDDRRHVALVVAHEFAHMWFGNLVTMAWWDDLWLNEAFAEWIAHKCADTMDPTLDVWQPFRQRASSALATDALASTHAIYHPVKTPDEAQEMFDAITYGKGSAVMRMLESFLGEEAFRDGLRAYMAAFRFDNARGSDLWRHLGQASGEDVAAIMQDWVTQPGHPTVHASWDGRLHLRQQRTRSSPLARVEDAVWRVPLVVRYHDAKGTHERRFVLDEAEATLELDVEGDLEWLWANAHDGGFYRVALDDGLREKAITAALAPEERAAMLRDLWMQVRADTLPVQDFLAAFDRLVDGRDHYAVVQATVALMRQMEKLLEAHAPDALPGYRAWVRARLGDAFAAKDEEDTPPIRERRAALMRAMGAIGRDEAAIRQARELAAAEREDPGAVEATLAGTAVAVEAVVGDEDVLRTHVAEVERRRAAQASPQEVERYLYVLPSFRDPALVEQVVGMLRDEQVSAQAEGPILRGMLVEPHAQHAAWSYLRQDWDRVTTRLGDAWLAILVEACGELPTDDADAVVAFLEDRLEGRATQAFGRARERLDERAELARRVVPGLVDWMAQTAV